MLPILLLLGSFATDVDGRARAFNTVYDMVMTDKPEIVPGHVGYSPDYRSDKMPGGSSFLGSGEHVTSMSDAERRMLVADIAAWLKKHPKLDPRIADDLAFEVTNKYGKP